MFFKSKKRSNRKRHGQITLFVIVGLVIFFAFAFALYARVKIINMQITRQADNQIEDYIDKNSINQYVNSCLNIISDDVFLRVSMQGGRFNFTGLTEGVNYTTFYDPIYNRTFNVSITIDTNTYCPDGRAAGDYYLVTQIPPDYPSSCRDERVSNMESAYMKLRGECNNDCTDRNFFTYSGFFGINSIPILCNPAGANKYRVEGGMASAPPCDYYEYYEKSMQQLIEEEIAREIEKCVNFTEVLETTASNITDIGNATTTVMFKKDGSIIKLQYPFTIVMQKKYPVTRVVDFSIEKDIPFKDLYEYSYELANSDIKDAKFNIFRDMEQVIGGVNNLIWRNKNMYKSKFDVMIHQGNISNGFINVIQVTDRTSNIRGLPLTITFAIKNRRPVLDLINEGHALYDRSFLEGQQISLDPQGYDPDDELRITYNYSGWLEDYVDEYRWDLPECNPPESIEHIISHCTRRRTEATPLHNWTRSTLFTQTKQNASYNATHMDAGYHVVRISVTDRQGLYDYQDVRILVVDQPEAKIEVDNLYEHIANNLASYEDLYILDGTQSTAGALAPIIGGSNLIDFRWEDSIEPFNILVPLGADPEDKILRLPYEDPELMGGTITMENIVDYAFRKNNPLSPPGTIHNIKLTVRNSVGSGEATLPVTVQQCLPHRSNVPSYPFDILWGNTELTQHLQSNHTCCADDGTITAGAVCYQETNYGPYTSFNEYNNPQLGIGGHAIQYYNRFNNYIGNTPTGDYVNDVYYQEFTRECSGNRGNICDGDVTETRTVSDDCLNGNGMNDPLYYNAFNDEQCSGPSSPNAQDDEMTCTSYWPGQTFESMILGTGNGICTTTPQCSDGTGFRAYSTTMGASAIYSCSGQCDGGRCNTPTACTCDWTCSNNVNLLCNGIAYPGTNNGLTTRSCNNFGQTYFEDRCVECGLQDITTRCVASTEVSGCTANQYCNGRPPGGTTTQTVCAPADTTRRAICGPNCQLVPDPTDNLICRGSQNPGCNGYFECNERLRNSPLASIGVTSRYCDANCQLDTCLVGHFYEYGVGCHWTCTSNSDCSSGYQCCTLAAGCTGSSGAVAQGSCFI